MLPYRISEFAVRAEHLVEVFSLAEAQQTMICLNPVDPRCLGRGQCGSDGKPGGLSKDQIRDIKVLIKR